MSLSPGYRSWNPLVHHLNLHRSLESYSPIWRHRKIYLRISAIEDSGLPTEIQVGSKHED